MGAVIEQPGGELAYGAPQHPGSPTQGGGRVSYVPPLQQQGLAPLPAAPPAHGSYGPIV